jgi:hypothetical protein
LDIKDAAPEDKRLPTKAVLANPVHQRGVEVLRMPGKPFHQFRNKPAAESHVTPRQWICRNNDPLC